MASDLSVMGHVLKYGDDCYFAENLAIIAYVIMGNICNYAGLFPKISF